ncbi:hypothetical protein RQP46_009339 [Phenoliferia psychrophenolica]
MNALAELRAGTLVGTKQLSLRNADLSTLPPELASIASTLEHLDLSDNPRLGSLPSPDAFPYHTFTNLKIVFFSNCTFETFPPELALFSAVTMTSFRSNGMRTIAPGALPLHLRWLILTGNELIELPEDIGRCLHLEKVMLAGNQLAALPASMAQCRRLALLRISCNALDTIPEWLWTMPRLAFLAFAGNPCTPASTGDAVSTLDIPASELAMGGVLGQGASGVISQATWGSTEVAVKIFKSSTITSDGSPADEMAAALRAGRHANLVSVLGRLVAANGPPGIVLELVPPTYSVFGGSPSFDSCSRDVFTPDEHGLSPASARAVLRGIASAAQHCHSLGIFHGDLYFHNTLFDRTENHALLGDFGAATIYDHFVTG